MKVVVEQVFWLIQLRPYLLFSFAFFLAFIYFLHKKQTFRPLNSITFVLVLCFLCCISIDWDKNQQHFFKELQFHDSYLDKTTQFMILELNTI